MSIRVAIVFGISILARGQESEALRILENVESKYKAIKNYIVEITYWDRGHCMNCGSAILRPTAPIAPPSPSPQLLNHIFLARSGEALRYEAKTERNNFALTWITDGVTTWQYRADLEQYTESGRPAAPSERSLPGLESQFLTRFRTIATVAKHATIIRTGRTLGDTCSGKTVLIEVQLSENPQAIEQLLIATDTGLVCESSTVKEQVAHGTRTRYTSKSSWKYLQLSEPIDRSLFTFTPPKKARRVKRVNQETTRSPELPAMSAPFGLPSAGPVP
jgi:outer membrane lipoprotein-sorting protein